MTLWLGEEEHKYIVLKDRQGFFDIPSPLPEDLEAIVARHQRGAIELHRYLAALDKAHREKRKWDTVEMPAWLRAEYDAMRSSAAAEADSRSVSKSVQKRLATQLNTNQK